MQRYHVIDSKKKKKMMNETHKLSKENLRR